MLVPGAAGDLNQELEKAGRVADYLEFAEVMVRDARRAVADAVVRSLGAGAVLDEPRRDRDMPDADAVLLSGVF